MTKLAKKETTALTTALPQQAPVAVLDPSDILIPRILIAQAMSTVAQDGDSNVRPGNVYRSTSKKVLTDKSGVVSIIPLHVNKTRIISKKNGGRYEYVATEQYTYASKELPWKWEENGVEFKGETCLNFYVLLPGDIASDVKARKAFAETGEFPDTDDTLLPCLLTFKSSSYRAGKVLITHLAKCKEFGVPAYVNTFKLTTKKQTNDQGTFYTFEVEKEGKTDPSFVDSCAKWTTIVTQQGVQVDASDEVVDAAPVSKEGVPF